MMGEARVRFPPVAFFISCFLSPEYLITVVKGGKKNRARLLDDSQRGAGKKKDLNLILHYPIPPAIRKSEEIYQGKTDELIPWGHRRVPRKDRDQK